MTAAPADYAASFSADPAHVQWLGERILAAATGRSPQRLLDIGCGDGSLLAFLANAWPNTECVGVDRSEQNVTLARMRAPGESIRVILHHADYLQLRAGRFDLVIASSTLQAIDSPLSVLADKLADDVAAGGLLIHVTPYRCAYNSALNAMRRALRLVRGAPTDHLILAAARVLHPREPREKLRERLAYMYMRLRHYEDDLRAALARRAFSLIDMDPAPHTSPGQPKQRLAIMRAPR